MGVIVILHPVGKRLIRARPNTKPPIWAKYATPPPWPSITGAEGRTQLDQEPEPEHYQGGQLDDGKEDDDEHHREHPRARIEDRVAAEHGRDRPAGAEVGTVALCL